ncbi:MAG: glutamate--tRNA ligase family protein [Verrucomicrobiota bacterium]|nr:glutamate--tRNA ligase family protein [Verrucomicrobiota bacterium]
MEYASIVITGQKSYRGRLAPSPTGFLHLGHAKTFLIAQERALSNHGVLIFRNEDLDNDRVRDLFKDAMISDLKWLGLSWSEGPDVGGAHAPYDQSGRIPLYRDVFEDLRKSGHLYPCACSRKDVRGSLGAPQGADEEPVYPGTCRTATLTGDGKVSWRFRVPDRKRIEFTDLNLGPHHFIAGRDFGDFVVWRHDDIPAYQLAVVVDDHLMEINEVVRGADLLVSTARQILLYEAMGWVPPAFYHCHMVLDEFGNRLAKRDGAMGLNYLREKGVSPEQIIGLINSSKKRV